MTACSPRFVRAAAALLAALLAALFLTLPAGSAAAAPGNAAAVSGQMGVPASLAPGAHPRALSGPAPDGPALTSAPQLILRGDLARTGASIALALAAVGAAASVAGVFVLLVSQRRLYGDDYDEQEDGEAAQHGKDV